MKRYINNNHATNKISIALAKKTVAKNQAI